MIKKSNDNNDKKAIAVSLLVDSQLTDEEIVKRISDEICNIPDLKVKVIKGESSVFKGPDGTDPPWTKAAWTKGLW